MAIGRENLSVPSEVANHPRFVEMVSPDIPKKQALEIDSHQGGYKTFEKTLEIDSHQRIIRVDETFFFFKKS